MFPFCPLCGNLMFVQEGEAGRLQIICRICPVVHNITETITSKTFYKLKEIDDVLDGEEVWKNVDSTEETCPKCNHPQAYFMQLQTRSADEPMTIFYRCCNHECAHNWKN